MCFTACSSYNCKKDPLSAAEPGQKLENFFCLMSPVLHIWPTFVFSVFNLILPVALWSWGRLSLQQKGVPGIFPGRGKGGRCVGLTTFSPSSADWLEILGASNSWNLSGPVQGLFTFTLCVSVVSVHLCFGTLTASELAHICIFIFSNSRPWSENVCPLLSITFLFTFTYCIGNL
jgi:hypothetical protein